MDSTYLIFQPFNIRCSECLQYKAITFEDAQYNEEITCVKCANAFTPNMDVNALLASVKITEENLAQREVDKDS